MGDFYDVQQVDSKLAQKADASKGVPNGSAAGQILTWDGTKHVWDEPNNIETIIRTSTFKVTGPGDFLADVATTLTLPDSTHVTLMGGEVAAVRYFAGAWQVFTASPAAVQRDTTPPTAGTLTVNTSPTTAMLTVTGALDDIALADLPYRFSKNGGQTWTDPQESPTYQFTGLPEQTSFDFRHDVLDAANNRRAGATVTKSTTKTPVFATVGLDTYTAADGTALSGRTTEVGGFTTNGSGTILNNRIQQGQVTTTTSSGFPAPAATNKNPTRVSANYSVGSYLGSVAKISVWTNATGSNSTGVSILHDGTVSFMPYSSPNWTVTWTNGSAPKVSTSGVFSIEVDPLSGSGSITINGAKIATLSGPTTHIAGGASAVIVREGWIDDLKLEVAT